MSSPENDEGSNLPATPFPSRRELHGTGARTGSSASTSGGATNGGASGSASGGTSTSGSRLKTDTASGTENSDGTSSRETRATQASRVADSTATSSSRSGGVSATSGRNGSGLTHSEMRRRASTEGASPSLGGVSRNSTGHAGASREKNAPTAASVSSTAPSASTTPSNTSHRRAAAASPISQSDSASLDNRRHTTMPTRSRTRSSADSATNPRGGTIPSPSGEVGGRQIQSPLPSRASRRQQASGGSEQAGQTPRETTAPSRLDGTGSTTNSLSRPSSLIPQRGKPNTTSASVPPIRSRVARGGGSANSAKTANPVESGGTTLSVGSRNGGSLGNIEIQRNSRLTRDTRTSRPTNSTSPVSSTNPASPTAGNTLDGSLKRPTRHSPSEQNQRQTNQNRSLVDSSKIYQIQGQISPESIERIETDHPEQNYSNWRLEQNQPNPYRQRQQRQRIPRRQSDTEYEEFPPFETDSDSRFSDSRSAEQPFDSFEAFDSNYSGTYPNSRYPDAAYSDSNYQDSNYPDSDYLDSHYGSTAFDQQVFEHSSTDSTGFLDSQDWADDFADESQLVSPSTDSFEIAWEGAKSTTLSRYNGDSQAMVYTEAGDKHRARKRSRVVVWLVLFFALCLLIAGAVFAVTRFTGGGSSDSNTAADYQGSGDGSVLITIDQGALGSDIAQLLYDNGVIASAASFNQVCTSNSLCQTIQPGTYQLAYHMSASAALDALLNADNRVSDNAIAINTGQTVEQIKSSFINAGFSESEVEAAFTNTGTLGLPSVAGGNLEGWIASGTYQIGSDDTVESMLSDMVAAQVAILQNSGVAESEWMTVLTKASIVEREVAYDEYMPQVARVIENRLNNVGDETAGRLQMDSTVLYGVGKVGGIPTQEDLENDNPYNTYLYAGLPPTPIAVPSQTAIEAVVNPADGDWLYFVTVNLETGETLFANTLAEQQANVELFNQYCAENADMCG